MFGKRLTQVYELLSVIEVLPMRGSQKLGLENATQTAFGRVMKQLRVNG
jgi:hypothetical protein